MYEVRLRRLLLAFYVLLGVIAARAFALQLLEAEDPEGRPWASLVGGTQEFVVHPRRGEILWADGSRMAWNVPTYGLEILWGEVDHRIVPTVEDLRAAYPPDYPAERAAALEASLTRMTPGLVMPKGAKEPLRRWRCLVCSTQRACRGDPADDGPSGRCRDCGALDYEQAPPLLPEDLAIVLRTTTHRVHVSLVAAMRRRERRPHWRSHALMVRIPDTAVEAISALPQRFGGLAPLARNGRDVDPLAERIAGSTRLPDKDDIARLTDETRAERGLYVHEERELYTTLVGASFLEREHDDLLRGVPGRSEWVYPRERDFERTLREIRPVEDGADLRTTLRRDLQQLAQEIVDTQPDAAHGAAVLLDVRTGEVLALATTDRDALDHARSHAIPGSVYKLVTAVAALETGHSPEEELVCRKKARIEGGGRYVCMHEDGPIALHDAFVRSCNGYFAQQAVAVGADGLIDAATRLGIDERPLKDALGWKGTSPAGLEHSDPEDDPELWKRWQLSQIGIGQGAASASPLQVAVAYARIASGGRVIEPFVLERDRRDAAEIPVDPVLARWAPLLREAARGVVADEEGTAEGVEGLVRLEAAGKTGTADVKVGEITLNNASFVGFAPYDAPRYCAVVAFQRVPQKRYGAGEAGDPVARLLEAALGE